MIKGWWVWAFWVSPLSYGQRAISVNEFTATRWNERTTLGNIALGNSLLQSHSLPAGGYWYWLGVGVLLLYALFFNIIVTLALTFLNPIRTSQAFVEENSARKDAENRANIQEIDQAQAGNVVYHVVYNNNYYYYYFKRKYKTNNLLKKICYTLTRWKSKNLMTQRTQQHYLVDHGTLHILRKAKPDHQTYQMSLGQAEEEPLRRFLPLDEQNSLCTSQHGM
ncbi:unnamed protein product [Cuscuta epithymum]|uniref:Plant PDR ABC transporter associated domain-containing protein n=1 Tax=Cuscuta epithymum TaxID=186058 RepID=A0AAV0EG17_9ASTE|nr:unnamed protein product [Cuscuta epithymum]